jgi:FdhD protein
MRSLRTFSVKRIGAPAERVTDQIAVEEPLAISVKYWQKDAAVTASLALTMRTPGHDRELAAGLLLSEGVIHKAADLSEIRALGTEPSNEVLVELARGIDFEAWRMARNGFVSSSCGVCGKRSREAMQQDMPPVELDDFRLAAEVIHGLPAALRAHQPGFAETGGLHAAALFTGHGQVEAAFEDIGRHNALDKLTGWALLNGRVPLHARVLFMSSRGSFELVQKAAMAGAPVLATVGGPSSLAIETARELHMTLLGFVREQRFNIYSGDWRINSKIDEVAVSQ